MLERYRKYKCCVFIDFEYTKRDLNDKVILCFIATQKITITYHNFRCPTYTNLPLGCSMVKSNSSCCEKVECTGTSGSFVGSGTVPGVGGYPVPTIQATSAPPLPGQPTPAQPNLVPKQIGKYFGDINIYQQVYAFKKSCSRTALAVECS